MQKTPTITDIAKTLDISVASVSRALRDQGKVSTQLRKRILAEADRIGYRPNQAARTLRTHSTGQLGLIVPNFFSHQIGKLVTYIQHHAQANNYSVILGVSQWDIMSEVEQMDFMARKGVDGIIIKSYGSPISLDKMNQLSQSGVKIVSILDKTSVPKSLSVLVDNIYGGYLATKHLLDMGHRNICYLTYEIDSTPEGNTDHFLKERYSGLLNAYSESKIHRPPEMIAHIKGKPDEAFSEDAFDSIINDLSKYTAFFAYDDHMASSFIRVLQSRNIKILQDYSIVCFDDSPLVNRWCSQPLTAIRQPDEKIALEAVNEVINRPHKEEDVCTLLPELIIRNSVRDLNKDPI